MSDNVLLREVEYKVTETKLGRWRRHATEAGQYFEEFVSHAHILGLPLIHFTRGRSPETGKRIVARGVIAIGRIAVGLLAVGHASVGLVAVGQLGLGLLFGLGQAASGVVCVGQFGLGLAAGLGQFVTGWVAVGQFAFGRYVLAQFGVGGDVWDMREVSPAAEEFFRGLMGG